MGSVLVSDGAALSAGSRYRLLGVGALRRGDERDADASAHRAAGVAGQLRAGRAAPLSLGPPRPARTQDRAEVSGSRGCESESDGVCVAWPRQEAPHLQITKEAGSNVFSGGVREHSFLLNPFAGWTSLISTTLGVTPGNSTTAAIYFACTVSFQFFLAIELCIERFPAVRPLPSLER